MKINTRAMERAINDAVAQLEQDLNAELQRVVRAVRDEMSGQPADEVYAVLMQRLTAELPDLTPNEEAIREVAAEIEAGTLTG